MNTAAKPVASASPFFVLVRLFGYGTQPAISHDSIVSSHSRQIRERTAANRQSFGRMRQAIAAQQREFVLTELDAAVTFCQVAISTKDPARKARNIENASMGYRTALRFSWTPAQDLKNDPAFQQKLLRLKALLRQLGQEVQEP